MNKFISNISKNEMREYLVPCIHEILREHYSDYKIERSFVTNYDDYVENSSSDIKLPKDIYLFRSLTKLNDQGEMWSEENLFIIRVGATSFSYDFSNYDVEDYEDEQQVFEDVVSMVKHPEQMSIDKTYLCSSYISFVASRLSDSDYIKYRNFVEQRLQKNHLLEHEEIKNAFGLAKKLAHEQGG